MKTHHLILAAVTLFLHFAFDVSSSIAQNNFPTRADSVMQKWVTDQKFDGAVLVAQSGRILFEKGYGLANREWDLPNSPKTKFRIASLTKQFTAAAILILQEQGKLKVGDSVSQSIPGLPKEWQSITIHQLLTHTSGLPEYTQSPEIEKSVNLTGATPEQILDLVRGKPLNFSPGSKMIYCNTGYLLVGMIIEKISGHDYGLFLKQHIFEPLKLNDTGYDSRAMILTQRAIGYTLHNGKVENAGYVDASVPFAAGGVYSTVEDLFRWNEALASGKFLSADSRKSMFAVYPESAGYGAHYGYGVVIDQRFGQTLYYHGGGIKGFASAIQRYPESNLCVVVLSNDEEIKSWEVADSLAGLALGK